jgi:hypothetical protein
VNRTRHGNRITLTVAGVLTTALLAACSSDSKTLSSGGFADEMSDVCRTATRSLRDLDETDPSSYGKDLVDIVETAFDDLDGLKPSSKDKSDFADFTGNVDDQASAAKKMARALDGGDFQAAAEEYATFQDLGKDNDDIADGLGADRCVGMFDSVVVPVDTTATVPDVSVPDVSIPTSDPPATDPPASSPPVTIPDVTPPATPAPPMTVPATAPPATSPMAPPPPMSGSGTESLPDFYQPPIGYQWDADVSQTLTGVFLPPSSDPALGPVLLSYGVGAALPAGGAGPAIVARIASLTTPYTGDLAVALLSFVGIGQGFQQIVTPGGFDAILWAGADSGETYDLVISFFGADAVMVQQEVGYDPAASLDAFINANLSG